MDDQDYLTLEQLSQSRSTNKAPPSSSSSRRKQTLTHDKAKECAKERAQEVEANLDHRFPSFVKVMLHSHVSRGFWLGIPSKFCKLYLPKQDAIITLVDEDHEEFLTKFLAQKIGLSAGWRGFSIAHKLVAGDALVFHLLQDTKFQVYIIRAYSLGAIDGAVGLLSLDSYRRCTNESKDIKSNETCARKHQRVFLSTSKRRRVVLSDSLSSSKELLGSDSEEVCSEVVEGIRFSQTAAEFKDVNILDNFTIAVNNLIINSEISMEARKKYYELCLSQNSFLHKGLLEGINIKLAAGVITETVDMADSIKASKISTSQENFAAWDKSLGALEQLGMDIGFLRARLQNLKSISFESEVDRKHCDEAQATRALMEDDIRAVKAKLAELDKASKVLDTDIETLGEKARRHEVLFRTMVESPW